MTNHTRSKKESAPNYACWDDCVPAVWVPGPCMACKYTNFTMPAVYMQAVPKRAQREDGSGASSAAQGAADNSPRPAAEAEAEAVPAVSKRGRQLKQVRSHVV